MTTYQFKLRWWFPKEDYKAWETTGLQGFLGQALQPASWARLAAWWATRTPFNQTDFTNWANVESFYVYIRDDLAPRHVPRTASWDSARRRAMANSVSAPSARSNDVPDARTGTVRPRLSIGGATLPRPLAVVRAVAVDKNGAIYVTDSVTQRVATFDAGGRYLTSWGAAGTGPGQFGATSQGPMGIASGPDGRIYVADTWNHRVQEFTSNGTFVRAFGRPNPAAGPTDDSFFGPRQLAVAPNGNIYVADTGNERIQVYSPRGAHLFNIGAGSHNGETALGRFDEPSGVAIDAHGVVYVADYWDRRIQRFTLDGKPLAPAFPVPGWVAGGDYGEPYLAVDGKGHLFATDAPQNNAHAGHILELDAATGALIRAFGVPTGAGALHAPSGIAVGPDGALSIADVGTATLLQMRP